MTKNFHYFTSKKLSKHLKPRDGETKFGEKLKIVNSEEELKKHSGKFVVFGIEEDIGIQGNLGKPGARKTWGSFLDAFVNIQQNRFNSVDNILLLGQLSGVGYREEAQGILDEGVDLSKKLDPFVRKIDDEVTEIIEKIVGFGKVPIIIGGGHNNAFGILRGVSKAKNAAINCLNIDAHTDLRQTDFRHSGNGFSFARQENHLQKYAMMGVHKNYTPEYIFQEMDGTSDISCSFYEDLIGKTAVEKAGEFLKLAHQLDSDFGLELDCDGIANFPSSAQSPTGFSFEEIRLFLKESKQFNPHYVYICEAAAMDKPQVGKALSYLVSDFIRNE